MSTYPLSGFLPQHARYIGEFVPGVNTVQYYYRVIAYNRVRSAITNANGPIPTAFGPKVLDGDHAISVNWTTVIGASYYVVYRSVAPVHPPPATEQPSSNIWYLASASETEILDVGYPCATRNSFLNPGVSPIYPVPCCDNPLAAGATNVPPVGDAPPASTHQGGGFVRVESGAGVLGAKPGGRDGDIQFNDKGKFGGAKTLYWDKATERLGIHTDDPKFALDVDGGDED